MNTPPVRFAVQITPSVLDRYESKYTIPESMVDEISSFISPYCSQDEYSATEETGFYTVNSLYFDTPQFLFLRTRISRAESRFSMRIRSYGDNPVVPYFLEIKRKRGDIIRKTRAKIFQDDIESALKNCMECTGNTDDAEIANAALFCRTLNAYNAHPVVFTQYKRKAYAGDHEEYARVTFDKRLRYAASNSMNVNPNTVLLSPSDYQDCFDSGCSIVLELKCYTSFVPLWMVDLVKTFNLKRRGFSKYSSAMRQVFGMYSGNCPYIEPSSALNDFNDID